ncbi:MAG: 16S rRNA (guanine(527)-N(7))-methyltransferase RsmG [Bacteroidota bacterium]
MVDHELIFSYFPNLSELQQNQIKQLYPVYKEWNDKINVVSRKDIDELYIRHVLHSLAIAKLADFSQVHTVLDIGTGGGFPGIPLAILYPDIEFHLVDSIGKKIAVVEGVVEALELKNVKAEQARAEQIRGKYDVVTCRAVTQLVDFFGWIAKNLKPDSEVLCLKGGDLSDEISVFKSQYKSKKVKEILLSPAFNLPFFETKKLLIIR